MLLPGANFCDKITFLKFDYFVVEQLILKYEVANIKIEISVTPYWRPTANHRSFKVCRIWV